MGNCPKCGKKIEKDYEFCPYCGNLLEDKDNWGMLGKNDEIINQNTFGIPFFGGGILNKMLGSAMKMLEKELQRTPKKTQVIPKTNLQLYINGKKINIGAKPIGNKPRKQIVKKQTKGISPIYFTKKKSEKFNKLKKQNPLTSVRRLSDRIIYDIEMPDVKSKEDISIIALKNSIEIKAIGKKKAYYKIIQIGLPIIDYSLEKGKLILELNIKK